MLRHLFFFIVPCIALAQSTPAQHTRADSLPVNAQLLQADRDFATATAKYRLAGWQSYWAEDASAWDGSKGFAQGADTLKVLHARLFSDSTTSLQWTPTAATSWTNDLGATTGTYRLIETHADGTTVERSHGTYLTLWRKTAAGWRVILDGGYPEQ